MSASAKTYPSYAKGLSSVVPYLTVQGAAKAAHFYERAFGAEIAAFHPVDDKGRTMHIHLYINGGSVMLSDAYPEHGHAFVALQGFNIALVVDDIDRWFRRAVDAGATVTMPVAEMFWGDRYGALRDPFGVLWSMNEPKQR
jgi:uncharacterized glyoxalase superfamily protein PhnB